MARKLTAAEAKARKEKKVLIALGVVLVAVGAFQGPKLMKQMKHKAPPVAVVAAPVPSPTGSSSGGVLGATSGSPLGHLETFSRLPLKDPFHALVATPGGTDDVKSAPPAPAKAANPVGQEQQTGEVQKHQSAPKGAPGPVGFTTTSPKSPPPPPPNAAVFKTNGKKQLVFIGDGFPTADPLFKLVALEKKAVRVGVLGGSFTSGASTIKLKKGKKVTLANEADGSHYTVQLVGLTNATPPPEAAASAPTTTPTTPAPAPTDTTTTPTTP